MTQMKNGHRIVLQPKDEIMKLNKMDLENTSQFN